MANAMLRRKRAQVRTVEVDSRAKLDKVIDGFLGLGFLVATRGADRAVLEKKRAPLNRTYMLIGLMVPVFGWIFLLFYWLQNVLEPKLRRIHIRFCDGKVGIMHRR